LLRKIVRPLLFFIFLISVSRIVIGQESILAIIHVNLIDATGAPVQADMTVIVQGKQILQLGKSASTTVPKAARVVDGRSKYLIPGLWDMHVHEIFGAWLPEDEKITPVLFVANGVTGVRDMGGDLEPLKKWRARIAEGKLLGPRMIIAGPMLDGPIPQFPSSVVDPSRWVFRSRR
jgi:imidazolonepropionase-like amidohydrolase